MNRKGFTLAEVLITLSILGVVAAIAIPNIIQQYQKKLTITKLQKAYANIEIMANNLAVNTGCIGKNVYCTGLFNISDEDEFKDKFVELSGLKVIKKYNGHFIRTLNLNKTYADVFLNRLDISKDNIGFYFSKGNNLNRISNNYFIELRIFTDTSFTRKNLPKISGYYTSKETIIGRNVFSFVIYDNFRVEPSNKGFGGSTYTNSANCNPNITKNDWDTTGWGCTLRIIRDGWKMNY